MQIRDFIDATYLKTAGEAGVTENENAEIVLAYIKEAIQEKFKLVMIRPEFVFRAKQMIEEFQSGLLVGTVIDFPLGEGTLQEKLNEAQNAIEEGVDELDFVVDYKAFKRGEFAFVKEQITICSRLCLEKNKVVKWIIEVAALNDHEIVQLTALVKNCIVSNFKESYYDKVYVKSSTGFFKTLNGKPNGATKESIKLMIENSFPLPVKAAGGVRNYNEAMEMIALGVKRIGTSAAKLIVEGEDVESDY